LTSGRRLLIVFSLFYRLDISIRKAKRKRKTDGSRSVDGWIDQTRPEQNRQTLGFKSEIREEEKRREEKRREEEKILATNERCHNLLGCYEALPHCSSESRDSREQKREEEEEEDLAIRY
jgi:hypothetical protein